MLPPGDQISKHEGVTLYDERGVAGLDSLSLINFMVFIEQKIQNASGISLNVLHFLNSGENGNPLQNIGILADALTDYLTSSQTARREL